MPVVKKPDIGKVPANFEVLAKTARVNNCVIYYKPTKIWFTPEELLKGHSVVHQDRKLKGTNITDFSIVKPEYILKQRIEWVNKANEELQRIKNFMKL